MNKYQYTVQGVDYDVEIEEVEGNLAKVKVNGIPFEVELKQPINAARAITKPKVAAPQPAAPAPRPVVAPVAAAPVSSSPAWHHHLYCCQGGRQGKHGRHRTGTRSHEDAEQHRGRTVGNHHFHRC